VVAEGAKRWGGARTCLAGEPAGAEQDDVPTARPASAVMMALMVVSSSLFSCCGWPAGPYLKYRSDR
jgi:hypothetical protein